jgi:hypothetical protein
MHEAMKERKAQAGVFLSRNEEGLAKEIYDWAEIECEEGPIIATLDQNLFLALRMLKIILKSKESGKKPEFDATLISGQIAKVRDSLREIRNINTRCSEISKGADKIKETAKSIRTRIDDSLNLMESAFSSSSQEAA